VDSPCPRHPLSKSVSERIRIQYGGSVKPENAKNFSKPDIDGASSAAPAWMRAASPPSSKRLPPLGESAIIATPYMFWTNIFINILLFFYVIDALLMCLVVLMQRSKQEGLGAAFGGGFTESVWGAQTSQVLVKTTVVLAVLFFVLSISLARLYSYGRR